MSSSEKESEPSSSHGMKELKFLDAVSVFQFNWSKIASHVNKVFQVSKTPQEIEEHFVDMYVDGNIGEATWYKHKPPEIVEDVELAVQCQNVSSNVNSDSVPEVLQEISYLPNRNSYEEEFYSSYDHIISVLKFNEEDDELKNALELACINIYINKVQERYELKQLVTDYKLVQRFSEPSESKSSSGSDNALRDKMRIFSRLMPVADHEALIQSDLKEKKLRARINELKEKLSKTRSATKIKEFSKGQTNKAEPLLSKPSKSKENKQKKNSSSVSQSNSFVKKEIKNSSAISSGKERKRPFQEEEGDETIHSTTNSKDLLSQAEKTLCSNLGMDPSSYMALKIVLLRERNNVGNSNEIWKGPTPKRNSSVQAVANFMAKNGWIKES